MNFEIKHVTKHYLRIRLSSKRLSDKETFWLKHTLLENNLNITEIKRKKLMKEWTNNNLKILTNSNINKADIKKASNNKECMQLRKGVKELFKYTYQNNIPVIIISAGITDIIENFLV